MNPNDIEIQAQEEKYRAQVELMRTIYTATGFFRFYFSKLPDHRTQPECFEHVNELHFDLFGEYRYSDYESFRRALSYHKSKNNLK